MLLIIYILVLTNNYLVLLISNIIVLYSNVLKAILSLILYRNHLKYKKMSENFL